MGFWIEYGFAIRGEPNELRKLQRNLRRVVKKCDRELNEFRDLLNIERGGMADWFSLSRVKKGALYLWVYIRCNWMDYAEFAQALRKRFVGDGPEMFYMINEGDLDPRLVEEYGVVTNDKEGKCFAYNPSYLVDEKI